MKSNLGQFRALTPVHIGPDQKYNSGLNQAEIVNEYWTNIGSIQCFYNSSSWTNQGLKHYKKLLQTNFEICINWWMDNQTYQQYGTISKCLQQCKATLLKNRQKESKFKSLEMWGLRFFQSSWPIGFISLWNVSQVSNLVSNFQIETMRWRLVARLLLIM